MRRSARVGRVPGEFLISGANFFRFRIRFANLPPQLLPMKRRALSISLIFIPLAGTVHADLTLSSGMTFAQEGGALGAGNLGTTGTAFALDLIGNGAFAPTHTIPNVNNGTFGNPSSWIGNSANSYVGVGFGSLQTIAGFAFGRDNTGGFVDRAAGTYTVQYTSDTNPALNHATATWNTVGTLSIASGSGVVTNAAVRHRFNIDVPVSATGFRLIAPNGAAIDELELFSSAVPGIGAVVTTASAGYSVTRIGTDGANFSPTGIVPDNLALASRGATAIASGELGPQISVAYHRTFNLNDGKYGNLNSWIGGDGNPAPAFAGVMLGGLFDVTSIAFGRDNGLDGANGDGAGAGQFTDRSMGTYTIQRTLNGSVWEDVGTVSYNYGQDGAVGGGFTSWFRNEFGLSDGNGGILATGVRVLVPGTGIGAGGTAIDEFEVYGVAVPEPSTGMLALAGAGLLLRRRRAK